MRYIKKRQTKFVGMLIGVIVMTLVAIRQFFLFIELRNAHDILDIASGRYHLWLATGAALMACLAGGLMFYFFLREDDKGNDLRVRLPLAPTRDNLAAKSSPSDRFDAMYWAQLNEWHVEGQADDRRPMLGSVGESTGSSSARRADARLSHQVMYKEWSKERHD